jgi:hypothetical protein
MLESDDTDELSLKIKIVKSLSCDLQGHSKEKILCLINMAVDYNLYTVFLKFFNQFSLLLV